MASNGRARMKQNFCSGRACPGMSRWGEEGSGPDSFGKDWCAKTRFGWVRPGMVSNGWPWLS
jgi:hypothetical protein